MKHLLTIGLFAFLLFSCNQKGKPVKNALDKASKAVAIDYKNVDVAGAKALIAANSDIIILDVRTPAETAEGMIPNAIEIDYKADNFASNVAKLDKNQKYLVYCRSGGRSVSASEVMIKAGFKDVTNMEGGFNAWK